MRPSVILLILLLAGCQAFDKNGHDKNGHDTYPQASPKTSPKTSKGPLVTDSEPAGSWWCFELSGDLRETDSREFCGRTPAICQSARTYAETEYGYSATQCTAMPHAICFPAEYSDSGERIEGCFITGAECERAFRAMKPGAEVTGCAIQSNDQPPTGDSM